MHSGYDVAPSFILASYAVGVTRVTVLSCHVPLPDRFALTWRRGIMKRVLTPAMISSAAVSSFVCKMRPCQRLLVSCVVLVVGISGLWLVTLADVHAARYCAVSRRASKPHMPVGMRTP